MQTETNSSAAGFSIAIDGPVGAGKGTISVLLAKRLNGFFLYTGGMYRAVALYCLQNNTDINDEASVVQGVSRISLDVFDGRIILNGRDVTEAIKKEEVGMDGSRVATYSTVRTILAQKQQEIVQRRMHEGKIVVGLGSDTATIVIPDAKLKIFLTARPEVRAMRRLKQIQQRKNRDVSFDQIYNDLKKRDMQDRERAVDPLVSNPKRYGYFVLDNSDMTEKETVDVVLNELRRRKLLS